MAKKMLLILIRKFFGISAISKLLKWNYFYITKLNPSIIEVDTSNAEELFSKSRRILFQKPDWSYGPNRVKEVSKLAFDGFLPYGVIT